MGTRREEQLEEALSQATAVIEQQGKILDALGQAPFLFGTVVYFDDKDVVLVSGGNLEVRPNPGAAHIKLKVGMLIYLNAQNGAIAKAAEFIPLGRVATYTKPVSADGKRISVSLDGSERLIFAGELVGSLNPGDRIMLDPFSVVAVEKMTEEKHAQDFTQDTGVGWEDIAGQEDAKLEMREAVEAPMLNAALFKHYGKKPVAGILLYGPPGNGKTMLGKAAATALAKLHGAEAGAAFLYVKGPEILDPYVGVSEQNVRSLFLKAREHKRETGYPAVIFIDEADAVLGTRGTRAAYMEKTIVPMFLTEMDGIEESGALVILATNRPDTLDPAITRDGRVDRKIRVGRPSKEDAEKILQLYLKKVPLFKVKADDAARFGVDELFDHRKVLSRIMLAGQEVALTLANIVSGAMLAAVAEQAMTIAMRRDLAAGGKPSGVSLEDIKHAVQRIYAQNVDVDHRAVIQEIVGDGEIHNIQKVVLDGAV